MAKTDFTACAIRNDGRLVACSLTLSLLLATSVGLAQQADNDVIASAKDVFGTSIGPESIGLYSEDSVRGFSPLVAGNARIDDVYFDLQGSMTNAIVDGSEILVGPRALGELFPAPTGIVNYHLRSVGRAPDLTTIIYCPELEVRMQNRLILSRIWSAVLVHAKGLGLRLLAAR